MHHHHYVDLVVDALIQIFSQHEPLGLVGAEEEYLLVKKDGALGSTQEVFSFFESQGFNTEIDPETKNVIGIKEDFYGVLIGSDAGINTIEINLPPSKSIHDIVTHTKRVLGKLKEACLVTDQKILGLGIMPNLPPEKIQWQKKGRYKKIREMLYPEIDIITTTASSQTHMVFEVKNLVRALNALMAISGPVISITANSRIQQNKISEYMCYREYVYHTFKMKSRIGMMQRSFLGIIDLVKYYLSQRMFLYKEENDNHFKKYGKTFEDFLREKDIKDVKTIKKYLKIHMGTIWLSIRLNPQGTLESRVCCQQPPWTQGSTHALNIGLMHNWQSVENFVNSMPWDFWVEAYIKSIKSGLFASINGIPMIDIAWQILELSEKGLQKRNMNEEIYLKELKQRLEDPTKQPSYLAEKIFKEKSIDNLIEKFSF